LCSAAGGTSVIVVEWRSNLNMAFHKQAANGALVACGNDRSIREFAVLSSDVVKKPSTLPLLRRRRREAAQKSAEVSFTSSAMTDVSMIADRHFSPALVCRVPAGLRRGGRSAWILTILQASGLGVLLTLGCCLGAHAFDGTKTPADDPTPMEAFRSGTQAYKAGDLSGASQMLEFAASKGHALAQWKLARMYSEGDGVPHDDYKAFQYYQAIVDAHGEDSPDTPQARFVSSAIVALGSYYLTGIPNSRIQPNTRHANEMFQYAATYFGDSDAQYNLGRIYLDGNAAQQRDPMMAARWLRLAADKGHHPAQAVLGHVLFSGDDMPRQAARGLMYLTLARDGASGDGDQWIIDLYNDAFAKATPDERDMCLTYLGQFLKDHS
jgi:uncharacterized protein